MKGRKEFRQLRSELKRAAGIQKLSNTDYENLSQSHFKSVRFMIALNPLTPVNILENLTRDQDLLCAAAARKCLKERKKVNNTTIH